MTEVQLRQNIVSIMQGWVGKKESNGSHKEIIDIYNAHKPLARNYKVKYTDSWCATTVSAAAIVAGLTDIIPLECSCGKLITLAKNMGIWQESDAYTPAPGDLILYDWGDSGSGDNTGWPEHIGMVEKLTSTTITVIEGNINNAVGRRSIRVNGKYIRGYIVPKYSKVATKEDTPNTSGDLKVGDIVTFTGNKHYTSAYVNGRARNCKSGAARITSIRKGKPHPYHVVAISGKGSTVHGWVDAADIEGAAAGSSSNSEIRVGDIVQYSGSVHYASSYASAKARNCRGGKAKVTRTSKGKAHPYHLEGAEKGCTVHGWVDADKVSK